MEMKYIVLFCLVLQVGSSCLTPCESTASQCESHCSSVRSRLLTPDNIRYFATFISPTASIQGRVIYIGPGTTNNEVILKVPLGEVDPRATIVITVGLNNTNPNTPETDSDLGVSISDGTNSNLQWIVDISNYATLPPCYPNSSSRDQNFVTFGTNVSSTFKLSFVPFYKYGACETAQDGGTINTGTFNSQVDTTKPLFLDLVRNNAPEQYYFHYLNIEVY